MHRCFLFLLLWRFALAANSLTVWLIPAENAGPNAMAKGERIRADMERFAKTLDGGHVRVLNIEQPLAQNAESWNPAFNTPNFQVVASQKQTINALQRFAAEHEIEVVVRFVTWDEAFGLLSASRQFGPDKLPDLAQIGSTWSAHFAGRRLIQPRTEWRTHRGNWRDVLGLPASALPYLNDARLLFYWKRLPAADPKSPFLYMNGSSWQTIIGSIRDQATSADTLAFPTGLTLNLLHDYVPLVWSGGGDFVSKSLFGYRARLTRPDALAIPIYLAQNGRIITSAGLPRQLVSYPESSHEEVSRIFVNGGYRATIEPANFVDRWAQDFKDRQPSKSFWDYAGAVVPPTSFKGGSELVVFSPGSSAYAAFLLAEFLATDPDYTRVLAEAGHLPSGRPGYGIDTLVASLTGSNAEAAVRDFSQAVQKAIDQGRRYPDVPQWPLAIENRRVLEGFQRMWRRISEGDVSGLHDAARQVEQGINSEIFWPATAWEIFASSWPLLIVPALVLVAYALRAAYIRNRSRKRLIILLHLYRANWHEAVKILGDNLQGLTAQARDGAMASCVLVDKLDEVARHYKGALIPHMDEIGNHLVAEVQDEHQPLLLDELISKAFSGAKAHLMARELLVFPNVSFASVRLNAWKMERFAFTALVIFQEWLYNCFRELLSLPACTGSISVQAESGIVRVLSPGQLTTDQLKALTARPSFNVLESRVHGLALIRDIAYCAFGSRISVKQEDGAIEFSVPLPITLANARNR